MSSKDKIKPARDETVWSVLFCPGSETIEFEEEMRRVGVNAWTPWIWVRKRFPRKKARVWVRTPILPGYMFVKHDEETGRVMHLDRLPSPIRMGLVPFTIRGKYVLVKGWELEGLRSFDDRKRPDEDRVTTPQKPPVFEKDDRVKVFGVFGGGVKGTVVRQNPQTGEVTVAIKNSTVRLRVSGFFLERL